MWGRWENSACSGYVQWQALVNRVINLWISYKTLQCIDEFSSFQLFNNDGAPSSLTDTYQVWAAIATGVATSSRLFL
jgi:hypothetical protein